MRVVVNGEPRDRADEATLGDLVTDLTAATTGIAVALNGVVVPRAAWSTTRLADDDSVEVLTAVQGG